MDNRKNIKTSILVSTYNWPKALALSVHSMFNQTIRPYEILIADDGSDENTFRMIENLKKESPIPIRHIWHEDKGFRVSAIRNKAIAQAQGDYILQIDGDVILPTHFVSDHLELAEKGYFVCGSRVKLSQEITNKILSTGVFHLKIWNMPLSYIANSFRSHILRLFLAKRYARKIDHLRGCNMAFWKDDAIKVNGYNEDLLQWGHEDGEFAFRLHFAGIKKKALKMGGNVYHLYHKEASRSNESRHLAELELVKKEKRTWCNNGIDKYINNP